MTFALAEKVSVMTQYGRREGWIRGRAFTSPMRYDVQTARELVANVPEEQVSAVGVRA